MSHKEHSPDPANWRGPDCEQEHDWVFTLASQHVAELRSLVGGYRASGRPLIELKLDACGMTSLSPELVRIRDDVLEGRGFALIRGLPVDTWTIQEAATAFWAIGLHVGLPISQNGDGHLLGHVCDIKADLNDPRSRKYATNAAQPFHTDSCDVVALLCLQPAYEGGLSSMTSSVTIHKEMLRRRPDLARLLSEPLPFDRKGEIPAGKTDFYMMPVFNEFAGKLTTIYARDFIDGSQRHQNAPRLTDQQVEALDLFDELAANAELRLDMELEPGDVQFVHNHQAVHARTAYRDYPGEARRRHLLRLWLSPANGRPLPPVFEERYGSVTVGTRRGGIQVPDVEERVVFAPE